MSGVLRRRRLRAGLALVSAAVLAALALGAAACGERSQAPKGSQSSPGVDSDGAPGSPAEAVSGLETYAATDYGFAFDHDAQSVRVHDVTDGAGSASDEAVCVLLVEDTTVKGRYKNSPALLVTVSPHSGGAMTDEEIAARIDEVVQSGQVPDGWSDPRVESFNGVTCWAADIEYAPAEGETVVGVERGVFTDRHQIVFKLIGPSNYIDDESSLLAEVLRTLRFED